MDNEMLIVIAIIVVALLIVAGAWMFARRRRTMALRDRFGPEYDHVLQSARTPAEAEQELRKRQLRVESCSVRPRGRGAAPRAKPSRRSVPAQLVDEPRRAGREADRLIGEVMRSRGYPIDEPDRRLDDLSVDHAHVLNHYRAGRDIVARHERGDASTEDLRQAMVHFRALFDELVAATRPAVRRAS